MNIVEISCPSDLHVCAIKMAEVIPKNLKKVLLDHDCCVGINHNHFDDFYPTKRTIVIKIGIDNCFFHSHETAVQKWVNNLKLDCKSASSYVADNLHIQVFFYPVLSS
jgi:hypothetical protein